MTYKNLDEFQKDKEIAPLIEDHKLPEEKNILGEIFLAIAQYEIAIKKRAEDDKALSDADKLKKELKGTGLEGISPADEAIMLARINELSKYREECRTELRDKFFDLSKELLYEGMPAWKAKHYEELKTLKDSIEFATKVVSNKSTDPKVFKDFERKDQKLSDRYQSMKTTAKRELQWKRIKIGLTYLLSLSMIVAGLALSFTGLGLVAGLPLIIGGTAIAIATTGASLFHAAGSPEHKLERYKSQDSIRKSVMTMFQADKPKEAQVNQKPDGAIPSHHKK